MLFRLKFAFGFLLLSLLVKAQSTSFGVHAIVNYSTFSEYKDLIIDDVFDYKIGYGIGGKITHELGQHFDAVAEINIERKGSGHNLVFTDENGNGGPTNGDNGLFIHLNYISVPLLIGYEFGEKLKLNFHVGSSFHYLVNVKSNYEYQLNGKQETLFNDINDYHRFDQSIIGGMGLGYPISYKLDVFINTRFNYGLIETAGNGTFIITNKNIAFSLLTGIQF